ncbi:MAG: DUF4123 domain-containing protein [Gemmatimonadales bacterium]
MEILDSVEVDRAALVAELRRGVLWAVIDGALDPGLADQLYAERAFGVVPLFEGTSAADLRAVGPYLVRLDRAGYDRLAPGWEEPWGVLLRSDRPGSILAEHLRKLLYVRTPSAERLYFRVYDPRVLRPFLTACDRAELGAVFGPIEAFGWSRLQEQALFVTPRDRDGKPTAEAWPFAIREAHLKAFRRSAEARLEAEIADHLRAHFPERCAGLDRRLAMLVKSLIAAGRRQELTTTRDLALYSAAVFATTEELDGAPPAWARGILLDPSRPPGARADRMAAAAGEHLIGGSDG